MAEYIDKQLAYETLKDYFEAEEVWTDEGHFYVDMCRELLDDIPAADVVELPKGDIGELSDGYHTFNSLYEQRKILTAALVKAHRDISWKSKLHEDGELPFGGGWFIVGLSTPEGEYTYHYELKDWDLFDCAEIPRGKRWDGHTDKDVKRLLSIPAADVRENIKGEWIYNQTAKHDAYWQCSICGNKWADSIYFNVGTTNFCPHCGADMRGNYD